MSAEPASYLMPAEWQAHQCCWMAWPSDHGDWPVEIESVRRDFVEILAAISTFEPVQLLVNPAQLEEARTRVPSGTELIPMELDDCWMRDMGPTMVREPVSGALAGVDWRYNGWGKFPHQRDRLVAQRLLEYLGYPCISSALVNEGGALQVDGRGTCVLTESVLLNANRNPGLSRTEAEAELRRTLGVETFVWLTQGLVDDDTDGHIDEIMCFSAPGEILLLSSSDARDANFERLRDARNVLETALGDDLLIRELEQPPAAYLNDVRLSRSYANCYIANGGVIMPAYGVADYDTEAYRQVALAFPGREVVQLDCSALVTGGGNIHCITQQCPVASKGESQ